MPAKEQVIQSVWTRPRRVRREQPSLSQEQIVAEAIRLLDADGIEALSMRRLGARLNAGATSLYSYVANKDELIELVVDEVYGEMEVPDADDPEGWRSAAARSAQSLRATILRHPWLVSVLGRAGFSSLGPNMMRNTDRMLAVFEAGGYDLDEADHAMKALLAYVVGMGTSEAAWLTALARSGKSQEEWVEGLWPAVEAAAQPYPRLRAWCASRRTGDPMGSSSTDIFSYGLDRLLDGLGKA
ncbi:TetR family transcriptional regulator (plasmid) [Streptomyces lunaelactis]|uniref:TetR family transcriptional regulator n=1 Tax=Streptomyces lunaelactis TaxID=1535768 RepID=A0A2R4TFN6_9ACTN|nr:TetR/AcrR family transcriptional regulator C-terminal domain-containing protein [Streptomyces lunaelactis]AVZ77907.1 TetR family transcriptional regulator [Streptomyces lunaelactis]NUK83432.1 TetR/AcrR family transcriptional regulator C-terminal domain-containing protein [Streptomyces lunaelactis]NUL01717.1 TetR/AcrR family transcriptional regulator C-terminal domain-containing protein [Streptomyces lunaelactis]